jgi:hypothetical protein
MHAHNKEKTASPVIGDLTQTVELFGTFLHHETSDIPSFIRNQACMRRLSLSFVILFAYLREASSMPEDFVQKDGSVQKQPEEFADYFIKKGLFEESDKESYVMLASMYMAIRWSSHGKYPDEEKIMINVQRVYAFLKKVVDSASSHSAL